MNIERFFYEHPVFRLDEFAAAKSTAGSLSGQSVQSSLQYYLKKGKIMRIRRELYAVMPPNKLATKHVVDPYLIAAKVVPDSILALHTAVSLYGLEYSVFNTFTYYSRHKTKAFHFQGCSFRPIVMPSVFEPEKEKGFLAQEINRQGVNIKVTTLEQTFVDILNRVGLSGGWEEVVRALDNMTVLDIERVIKYALAHDNAILNAKVGYFLEQRSKVFSASQEQIMKLEAHRPSIPQYISQDRRDSTLIKKWNIYLPNAVINRSWEENLDDF
ncbi:MAG: hypothetical protein DHS20C10_09490 [marine bacterium B5-7]|nr:MAG: hypothetical protein DHS20C10_09490 [marine bacterium B5-7]